MEWTALGWPLLILAMVVGIYAQVKVKATISKEVLQAQGLVSPQELAGVNRVLNAAALIAALANLLMLLVRAQR